MAGRSARNLSRRLGGRSTGQEVTCPRRRRRRSASPTCYRTSAPLGSTQPADDYHESTPGAACAGSRRTGRATGPTGRSRSCACRATCRVTSNTGAHVRSARNDGSDGTRGCAAAGPHAASAHPAGGQACSGAGTCAQGEFGSNRSSCRESGACGCTSSRCASSGRRYCSKQARPRRGCSDCHRGKGCSDSARCDHTAACAVCGGTSTPGRRREGQPTLGPLDQTTSGCQAVQRQRVR